MTFQDKKWCPPFFSKGAMQVAGIKGQLGVPPTVYPWYLLCSTLGFLGIITHKYPLQRAYIGISHRGTLVGVHPTIPWRYVCFTWCLRAPKKDGSLLTQDVCLAPQKMYNSQRLVGKNNKTQAVFVSKKLGCFGGAEVVWLTKLPTFLYQKLRKKSIACLLPIIFFSMTQQSVCFWWLGGGGV